MRVDPAVGIGEELAADQIAAKLPLANTGSLDDSSQTLNALHRSVLTPAANAHATATGESTQGLKRVDGVAPYTLPLFQGTEPRTGNSP